MNDWKAPHTLKLKLEAQFGDFTQIIILRYFYNVIYSYTGLFQMKRVQAYLITSHCNPVAQFTPTRIFFKYEWGFEYFLR